MISEPMRGGVGLPAASCADGESPIRIAFGTGAQIAFGMLDDELADDDLLAEARNERAQIEAHAQLVDRAGLRAFGKVGRIADRDTVKHQGRLCRERILDIEILQGDGALQLGGDLVRDHRPEPVPVPHQREHDEQSDTSADTGPDRMAMEAAPNPCQSFALPC